MILLLMFIDLLCAIVTALLLFSPAWLRYAIDAAAAL